jgi:predicted nucleotidyltransferase
MDNNLCDKFINLLAELEASGVEYCLIGGFAVVLHGGSRMTESIDLFVRSSEENLQRLRIALFAVYHDESIRGITSPELDRYPVIRYGTEDGFSIDIIARLGEAFTIDDLIIETIELNGHQVKIAAPETLYKLKEKTFRAIDQADLVFLRRLLEDRNGSNA